ncbi:MAG: MBL fold metallo-hydrolase, partial [Prevotella sp.]|nr:MBL fold metallo-hydrolase [Prevotella sp.]
SVTEDIRRRINRANYLVIEANYDTEMLLHGNYPVHLKVRIQGDHGHLANDACGMALVENASEGLRHVWLCHLSEENNHPELARKTVESILRSSGIVAGVDFQMDVLKRKTPTGVFELV